MFSCRARSVVLVAFLLSTHAWAADPAVVESSYVAPDGSRVLQHEVVVAAPLESVWRAFTTAEGLKEWAVPAAWVDFRLGGSWETSYSPSATQGDPANIRSRILSFQPLRMISLQAVQAPPGFEHPELLADLFGVFTFEEAANGTTLIRAAGIGYRQGEKFDRIYEFFRTANAWSLEQLRQRYETGPVRWEERLRQVPGRDKEARDDDEE